MDPASSFLPPAPGDRAAAPGVRDDEAALMAEHGISRVPADRFEVDGYRYTSLADAVVQAKRPRKVLR